MTSLPPSVAAPVPCSLPENDSYWGGASFEDSVLPIGPSRVDDKKLMVPEPSFLDYLKKGVPKTRQRLGESCRDSWAFALCASVELALQLSYEKLGANFMNRYLSAEYLLSCYEQGPSGMCGCRGADLPTAFKLVSERGVVSFSQFPYISSDVLNLPLRGGIDVVYFCENTDHLGTCPPCKASLENYSESVLAASPDIGAFRFIVPCLPCSQPATPKYFPKRPFLVGGNDVTARIAAVKRELLRVGPLCFALAVDVEVLTSLLSGGSPPRVANPHEGLFYRPRHVAKDASFYAALVVGYSETPAKRPFWVCHLQVSGGGFGYNLVTETGVVNGLFNVDMSDELAGTLSRVVSFEEVQIFTGDDVRPRSLSRKDPFLVDLASPAKVSTAVEDSSRTESLTAQGRNMHMFGRFFWISLSIVVVLALGLFWVAFPRSDISDDAL
jgi:hypothetical protein